VGNQPGQEHHESSLVGLERRPLDLARRHDQLLAEQRVLGDQLAARSEEVTSDSGHQRHRPSDPSPRGTHSRRRSVDEGAKP
jgi:hypothetical protein